MFVLYGIRYLLWRRAIMCRLNDDYISTFTVEMNDAAMKSPVIILYWQLLNKFIMLMKLREMLVPS